MKSIDKITEELNKKNVAKYIVYLILIVGI